MATSVWVLLPPAGNRGALRRHAPALRHQLAFAPGRTPGEVATDLRTPFVDRAKILHRATTTGGGRSHVQRRAMPVAHSHERPMPDKMRQPTCIGAEPRPIVTRHPHVGR